MIDEKKSAEEQRQASASFGSGLGADFAPLGRRLVIAPGKNHTKPKMKRWAKDDVGKNALPNQGSKPRGREPNE